ncbi:MAG: AMP-binding protein [Trueperaceae bacterium]|nr:AMP-binding protein [Trueperaceae bacterium]
MTPDSLPHVLADAAARHPGRRFLSFEGASFSYASFAAHVGAAAAALRDWGLQPGDRVALYLGNTPSYLIAYLAALWCGAAVVPANTRYREAELGHMLRDAGVRLVVTDPEGGPLVATARTMTPTVDLVLTLTGDLDEDRRLWAGLGPSSAAARPPDIAARRGSLALIAYTSGTTGRSKGAMLTHGHLLANARAVGRAWRWAAEDHLLLTLPLFHIHGLGVGFHGTLVHGAALTLHRRFDAAAVLAALEEGPATLFFGVPTMYGRLLREADERPRRLGGLRLLVSGSAPLAVETLEKVERLFGQRILERYGMTETVMLTGNPYAGPRKAGTVGVPFEGVELRLAGGAAEAGSSGAARTGAGGAARTGAGGGRAAEVQVRGPSVTAGYWNDPDATAAAFTPDGWFRTGDLGALDADGYLTLSGRARELIISGGFNVYPREVEEAIAALPGVREVAVVGLPDPDLGERVAAAIVVDPEGPAVDEAGVTAHCQRRLAGFKTPRTIAFVVDLPRNAMGKVLRHELRDRLLART